MDYALSQWLSVAFLLFPSIAIGVVSLDLSLTNSEMNEKSHNKIIRISLASWLPLNTKK